MTGAHLFGRGWASGLGGEWLRTTSPYAGFMAGAFVPVGDNDEVLPAFSLKAGSQIRLDALVAYGDLRYTHASHNDTNAGGIMLVAGLGLRLGLSK